MTLIAVPFQYDPTKPAAKYDTLLNGMVGMQIFPLPGTDEERRVIIAGVLTDPHNRAWEVWSGKQLVGCLLLTHIIPRLDATAHFAFWDRQLYGRKALVWNVLGKVFQELELQRISVELPEHLTPLLRWCEKKLYFKPEGVTAATGHPLMEKLAPYVANAPAWAARLGSRRERAYYRADTNSFVDCIRLRITKGEYDEINRRR